MVVSKEERRPMKTTIVFTILGNDVKEHTMSLFMGMVVKCMATVRIHSSIPD